MLATSYYKSNYKMIFLISVNHLRVRFTHETYVLTDQANGKYQNCVNVVLRGNGLPPIILGIQSYLSTVVIVDSSISSEAPKNVL